MTFKVVILSATAPNLVACVRAVLAHEPDLPPERIIVVDDGARAGAEPHLPGITWVPGVKPFVYARNANLGIRAAEMDVVLLNDDARLVVPRGFTRLAQMAATRPQVGICSAGIRGIVGNPRQIARSRSGLYFDNRSLAFVCVYIPRVVLDRVGPLDERFVGYGFEDNDYCDRIRHAGLELAIWDGCVVDHGGALPSSFRMRADIGPLAEHNRRLYQAKQQEKAMKPAPERGVDLLYSAFNRLEFTRETFTALVGNTDWQFVHELFVYDDGSTDGTREWLEESIGHVPAPVRLIKTNTGSPIEVMLDFIQRSTAPILAKTDNDAMLPPGWLKSALDVLDRHPELMLLGIEAMYPHQDDPRTARTYTPAEFVSGLGLYRRATFARGLFHAANKYYGFEEWQMAQGKGLIRGWITPALPVFLLDRFPFDPWRSWSDGYIQRGWQRPWGGHDPASTLWHWRWPGREYHPVSAPQNRPRINLGWCDVVLAGYTNVQIVPIPGPGDTDLRRPWPWGDDEIEHIRAWDVLEHLPDPILTMNELWRVLAPGGTAEVAVPTTDGSGAFQDPTHVSFWNRHSFACYEAGNPHHERLKRRAGLQATFRVLSEQIEQTMDGPRLILVLQAVKSGVAGGPASSNGADAGAPRPANEPGPAAERRPPASAAPDARYLAALRVRNEAACLGEVLASVLPLCERVLVLDDHSTDETAAVCRSFGQAVEVLPSPFGDLDEARDKNYLLQKIVELSPEWVLWIDGDEVLERSGPEMLRLAAGRANGVAAYSLRIAYLWDSPTQVRTDGLWGRFSRPSFFRLSGQPVDHLSFRSTGCGGNFHCGNVPEGLIGRLEPLRVRLKHYGYMTREQRQAKYRFYIEHDPGNAIEDDYRHLSESSGARWAPGPMRLVPWRE